MASALSLAARSRARLAGLEKTLAVAAISPSLAMAALHRSRLTLKIEAAIANSGLAQRLGVADKDQAHAAAVSRNAIS